MLGRQHDQPRVEIVRHVGTRARQWMDAGGVAGLAEVDAQPLVQLLRHLVGITLELLGTILRELRDRRLRGVPKSRPVLVEIGRRRRELESPDLALSPAALALLLLYSYTKRFTWLSHLVLGLCLALAPIGAWIAVRGSFAWTSVLLGLVVLFWTAGFGILYALQDEDHDRRAGPKSLPARWGTRTALAVSAVLHAAMIPLLLAVWRLSGGGALFAAGILATATALLYQHVIVKPGDLSRINTAFFTANGFVSVVLAVCGIADVLLKLT